MRVFSERDVFLLFLLYLQLRAKFSETAEGRRKEAASNRGRREGQTDWRYDMNGNASSEKLPDTDLANFHRLNGEWAAEKWLLPTCGVSGGNLVEDGGGHSKREFAGKSMIRFNKCKFSVI